MTSPSDEPDADLARRAAGGEERAFTLLMRRHKSALHRFAHRYVGDADAALDVVQETFVSAWSNLARYDPDRPFGPWLRRIALNKCRDRARRLAVRRMILGDRDLDSAEARARPDPTPGAEAALVRAQQRRRLDRAVAELPQSLREPLLLTWLEEMSHQEAAEILGVTPKAVETRLHRARRRLAEVLAPTRDGGG